MSFRNGKSRSVLGFSLRPSLLSLPCRLARRGRVWLGEHTRDRAAQDTDPDAIGDVDRDLLGVLHAGYRADDAASGHDPIPAPQRVEHRLVIFRLALLRSDQQEIEDDKNQDQRKKLYQSTLIVEYACNACSLGVRGRNQHRNRAPRSRAASTRRSGFAVRNRNIATARQANWYAMPG